METLVNDYSWLWQSYAVALFLMAVGLQARWRLTQRKQTGGGWKNAVIHTMMLSSAATYMVAAVAG